MMTASLQINFTVVSPDAVDVTLVNVDSRFTTTGVVPGKIDLKATGMVPAGTRIGTLQIVPADWDGVFEVVGPIVVTGREVTVGPGGMPIGNYATSATPNP